MSRAWMLNDTLVQHIHFNFAEGSGKGPQSSQCDRWAAVHGEMIDTDTCRVPAALFFRLLASHCQSRSQALAETSKMLLNMDFDV